MTRLLTAFAATSLVFTACASSGEYDELAGETDADIAADGKADAAVDGAYTYFEIYRDMKKCAAPKCGGYFLHRLNRTDTVCHNGANAWSCYTPEVDWTEANLSSELQSALVEAAGRDAVAPGVVAIVRGRFAPKTYASYGNLGRFVVTEAWVAEGEGVSEGVFAKVHDNDVRCIQAPCPTVTEKALNTSRSANIAGLDWSAGGFAEDQVAKMTTEMLNRPSGVIIAGERYTFKENNVSAKGRTVTNAYRRLQKPDCYIGGCSSQICSDQEGVSSTCDWQDSYACYATATCERQGDGLCGWTETPELTSCLEASH